MSELIHELNNINNINNINEIYINKELFKENDQHDKNHEIAVKKYKSMIKKADEQCKNEIRISEKLIEIPHFFLYFDPIITYQDFRLAEIDDERFEKCRHLNHSLQYYLVEYENREKVQSFSYFFKESPYDLLIHKKRNIVNIISIFKSLLHIIQLLNQQKIVHMNLVPKSINLNSNNLPFLTNFTNSFLFDEMDVERKSNPIFSKYDPNNIYLPLEVHLLCFMNENNYNSLSRGNIEKVVNDLFTAFSSSSFSKYISDEFKETYIFSHRSLINKPKYTIINELFYFSNTWNNYSLAIIYLQLLSFLGSKISSGSHKFINDFSHILLQNISPIPSRRETVDNTIKIFDDILYSISHQEWKELLV